MTYTTQEEFIDEIVAAYLVYVKEMCGEHVDCLRKDRFERFVEVESKKTTIKSYIDFENIEDDGFADDLLWIYYVAEYIQLYDRYHPKIPMKFPSWVLCKYGYNNVIKFGLFNNGVNVIHYINNNQYNVLNLWYGSFEVCLK